MPPVGRWAPMASATRTARSLACATPRRRAILGAQLPPRGANWGYYINPAYDKVMREEETTADQAQRKAIFGKMQVIMNHDLPSLWLYDPPTLHMYRNTLHNYAPGPFSFETWNNWEWW